MNEKGREKRTWQDIPLSMHKTWDHFKKVSDKIYTERVENSPKIVIVDMIKPGIYVGSYICTKFDSFIMKISIKWQNWSAQ